MTKLTYINNQQIIADAAQVLIEAHLNWSGSAEGMPSDDHSHVRGKVAEAYIDARFTIEEWDDMSVPSKRFEEETANTLFKKAAQIADGKWESVMTLLGIAS